MAERDIEIYRRQGFGAELGPGGKPALVVVDFVEGFADPAMFGGGNIAPAIARTRDLLALARGRGWPVFHTRVVFAVDGSDANIFTRKVPGLLALTEANPKSAVVAELEPRPEETVLCKRLPSAFAGTGFAAMLERQAVDTLVIAGCTTSGCIRATALDAMNHGLIPIVVEDCCGDRSVDAHNSNLFDIRQKCGDVMPLDDLVAALGTAAETGARP